MFIDLWFCYLPVLKSFVWTSTWQPVIMEALSLDSVTPFLLSFIVQSAVHRKAGGSICLSELYPRLVCDAWSRKSIYFTRSNRTMIKSSPLPQTGRWNCAIDTLAIKDVGLEMVFLTSWNKLGGGFEQPALVASARRVCPLPNLGLVFAKAAPMLRGTVLSLASFSICCCVSHSLHLYFIWSLPWNGFDPLTFHSTLQHAASKPSSLSLFLRHSAAFTMSLLLLLQESILGCILSQSSLQGTW